LISLLLFSVLQRLTVVEGRDVVIPVRKVPRKNRVYFRGEK
jgi:hypothetical protein